jgi:hypothetical protein
MRHPGGILNIGSPFRDQYGEAPGDVVASPQPLRGDTTMVAVAGVLAATPRTAAQAALPSPSHRVRQLRYAAATLALVACIGIGLPSSGWAQSTPAQDVEQQSTTPWLKSERTTVTVRPDGTAEFLGTTRIKVLGAGVLESVGKQTRNYIEGMQTLEVIEAYTEKANGERVPVDPENIVTADAQSGQATIYRRDMKARTIIFSDLAIGDTTVLTTRLDQKVAMFPGQFAANVIYPRQTSIAESTAELIAPKDMPLKVATYGDEIDRRTFEDETTIHHVMTYHPKPRLLAEPSQTSAWDRDTRIVASTFADYEAVGNAYWVRAAAKTAVTPRIQALADEITTGIDDRRKQAEAIDAWVKRNIRYVAIYLGAGGFVPNEAATVLKNKYGDCKDHVTLMSALLAAKGIASEHVLINSGNIFTLPDQPTYANFNHLIIRIPELGLYDDPTVSTAAFGVLGLGDYDKPVIRMSADGVYRDRTPAMQAADHVSINRTKLAVAADGTVTGETIEAATGVWASGSRRSTVQIQTDGLDKSAEKRLRALGFPGRGRFQVSSMSDFTEPYAVKAQFTLNEKMSVAAGGTSVIPHGLSMKGRPSTALLGDRYDGRQLPFVCYAASQVEEIELSFADGLPLPQTIPNRTIDNRWFSYTAQYRLEGRTLKIRREFVSRVPGQVCSPEVEAEIGRPFKQVRADLTTRLRFGAGVGAAPADQPITTHEAPAQPPAVATEPSTD